MRRRRRRCWLLLAAACVLLLLLVATVSHVSLAGGRAGADAGGRRPGVRAGALRRPVAIRSRQALLPVTIAELEELKETPLERWGQKQRKLLNMTFRPWLFAPADSGCGELTTSFSSQLPPTGLVSLPSSGNTWLRFLIEGAAGVFTGSVYSDIVLIKEGMYGEAVPFDSGVTLVQKTHGFTTRAGVTASPHQRRGRFSQVAEFGCRALLLVRSPLLALVGHRHLDAAGHLGFAPAAHFHGEGWDSYVREKALFWRELYSAWIEQCPPEQLLVVRYERLLEDLPAELGRVLDFLGVRPDPRRMQCLLSYPEGRMKRGSRGKRPDNQPKDPFTAEHKALVREQVRALDRLVRERGLGELPEYL